MKSILLEILTAIKKLFVSQNLSSLAAMLATQLWNFLSIVNSTEKAYRFFILWVFAYRMGHYEYNFSYCESPFKEENFFHFFCRQLDKDVHIIMRRGSPPFMDCRDAPPPACGNSLHIKWAQFLFTWNQNKNNNYDEASSFRKVFQTQQPWLISNLEIRNEKPR